MSAREDADQLIVRTREAHEALAELKQMKRELVEWVENAKQARIDLIAACSVAVDQEIREQMVAALDEYARGVESAIQSSEATIKDRFDELFCSLLDQVSEQIDQAVNSPEFSPRSVAMMSMGTIRDLTREAIRKQIESRGIDL